MLTLRLSIVPYRLTHRGVSKEFIQEVETLDGLESVANIYMQTSTQPFAASAERNITELSSTSENFAADFQNYKIRGGHGVNIYGFDEWPIEYLQVMKAIYQPSNGKLVTEFM